MEKNTVLAIVLSVAVIIGFSFFAVPKQTPPEKIVPQKTTQSVPSGVVPVTPSGVIPVGQLSVAAPVASVVEAVSATEEKVQIKTDLVTVQLSNRGGDLVSYKLNQHRDGADQVEMVLAGEAESHALTVAFGSLKAKPQTDLFQINKISDYVVEFSRDYAAVNPQGGGAIPFRLTKRYEFRPGEYLFQLTITIDGGQVVPTLNTDGFAYTLEFGPQIGPKFNKLDNTYDYRQYYSYTNGKKRSEKVTPKGPTTLPANLSWAAIAGKYFTVIAIADVTPYTVSFSMEPTNGIAETSRLFFSRPLLNNAKTVDTYKFYLGPKNQKALGVYDSADKNSYKLSEMHMGEVSSGGFLGPLENIMKWFLMIFYKIIPNYGVAIILLTILVKALLFPLTKKGSESTLRMQSVAPKIKEIQEKYKDNPNKMNAEMAELYKKEGYNPLSGCLPMLIQIPIFFAMYNLFNNHFDLRGAMFIPGWIPDLSLPETVWNFAPFSIPLLGWTDLRLLPFIYLVSQLLYGRVTQTPDTRGNMQMKLMLYVMPIVFFFILYNVPAGLLVYWIMSNLLTLVQQLSINKYLADKKLRMAAERGPVIAPRRKK